MIWVQFYKVVSKQLVDVTFVTVRPFRSQVDPQQGDVFPDIATRFDREYLSDVFKLDIPAGPYILLPHMPGGRVLDPIYFYVRDPAATVWIDDAILDWERWVAAGQPAGW